MDVHNFGKKDHVNGSCRDGDTATVNYTGKLATDGTIFDKSLQPFKFQVGAQEVIPCWDKALSQMQAGETATVTCPPDMAYGKEGAGDKIPGGSTLVFDIDVINCATTF